MAKSVAARATWMNRAIFLISFFSAQWRGSKSRTSPAIVQSKAVVSNWVIVRIAALSRQEILPDLVGADPQTADQSDTRYHNPAAHLMHTLLVILQRPAELLLAVLGDVVDRVFHGGDFFRVFVGDFNPKSLFKGHHQFHRVQGIRAQIVHKGSGGRSLRLHPLPAAPR